MSDSVHRMPNDAAELRAGNVRETRDASRDEGRDEDARLVLDIRSGDRAAEEILYRRYAPQILRLASRLLRSSEEARDVLQDTFLAAFEDLSDLDDPRALKGWLQSICVRRVQRHFRRRKLLKLLGLDPTAEDAKIEQQASPDADPEVRADLRFVDMLFDRLPSDEKVAWVLRHVEGMTLEETAETCRCSLATVKRRIAAAESVLERLRAGVIQ